MKNKGFTLIEFLVGITMTAFIFIVATNLVVSFLTINTKSHRSQDIEQAKTDIVLELTNALSWGENISYQNGVLGANGSNYQVLSGVFSKNGVPFTSKEVVTREFNVNEYVDGTQKGYEVKLTFEHRDSTSVKDKVVFFISPRIQ